MARVFVAMSGGVDSAAAALLALRAGHQVSGIHARMVRPADWGLAGLEEKLEGLEEQIMANATNSVKLKELMEEQASAQRLLEEKMERWVYLTELAERIEEEKNGTNTF